MPRISDAKILIIATNGFEQSELEFPRDQLRVKEATVHVATPDGKSIKGWEGTDWGRDAEADLKIADVQVEDYDALVLPGGQINPDILRTDDDAVTLIKRFAQTGRVIAAICHAPWLLVEAGIVRDREMTSYGSIKTDLNNAGADWKDVAVVCDNGIVTSRSPDDLEAFVGKIVEEVEEGRHARQVA